MSGRPADSGPGRTAPSFDQGIFLLHLNRGKDELRLGHYQEARRHLEDARRFRAREPEVLANLAFTLFHLGHFEDAEKITREVLDSFPTSVPLLFNLGLILFKAGRLAQASEPLERVLQLAPSHRKAHLTLGLVFRKLGQAEKARRHFQLAGAGRMAAGEEDDTLSRLARAAVTEQGAAGDAGPEVVTTPIVKPEGFQGGGGVPVMAEAHENLPVVVPPVVKTHERPPAASAGSAGSPFSSGAGGFLAAETARGVLIRREAVTGRRGSSVLEPETTLPETLSRLFLRARGPGTVLLVEKGRHPYLVAPGGGFLSVAPLHVLAFEGSLGYREDPAFEFRRPTAPPFLKLLGEGVVAMAVESEPARLAVGSSEPLTIAAGAVIGYSGDLDVELIEGNPRHPEFGDRPLFRFSGSGTVLAEAG